MPLTQQNVNNFNRNDKIFEFIYKAALADALQQKAFNGKKNIFEPIKPNVISIIKPFVDDVIAGKYNNPSITDVYSPDYDKDFLYAVNTVIDLFNARIKTIDKNSKSKFTYGNGQKLVNMILKYFFILCYNNPAVRDNFKFCHCPVDSRIKESVWDVVVDNNYGLPSGYKGTKTKYKDEAWSQMDDAIYDPTQIVHIKCRINNDSYQKFNKLVAIICEKEEICPLEVDYKYW